MLLSTLQIIGQTLITKNFLAQNVNSGKVEKACPGLQRASGTGADHTAQVVL